MAGFGGRRFGREGEAAKRFAERRRREDEAPRLSAEFPALEELRFEMQERRAAAPVAEAAHVRRIVVEHAPAIFIFPCGDSACKNGGHEITDEVIRALRNRQERFEGEDPCIGQIGSASCQRMLHFLGIASYRKPS